jgi:hypothetical protein
MILGYHLNMPPIPGVDIQKSVKVLILIDLVAGNIAIDYLAKNAIGHNKLIYNSQFSIFI